MEGSEAMQSQSVDSIVEAIESVVRERIGSAASCVDARISKTAFGDWQVTITIEIRDTEDARSLGGKLSGLTREVRKVLAGELRDVFPVIMPIAAQSRSYA